MTSGDVVVARRLRAEGHSLRTIAGRLGVAPSAAWAILRDQPTPERVLGTDGRWRRARRQRLCSWCEGPRPEGRPDTYCSFACRAARQRAARYLPA